MPAPLLHIESTPDLSREADAVVIGGGVVGVFTAYYLARRGVRVALVEKGRVAAEQSSRNWGWCRQQNRDARELPMATKSLQLWESVAQETGEDTGFRRCGLLYLSDDDAQLAGWAKWRDFARTAGVTTHMLSAEEASERGKATGRRWKGGVISPTDGTADPYRAVPVAARGIMAAGGTVHYGTDLGNGPMPTGLNRRELQALEGAGVDLVASLRGFLPVDDSLAQEVPADALADITLDTLLASTVKDRT